MKLIIDIPNTSIPKTQDIIDIKVHFISGQVCACDFPFEVVEQEQEQSYKEAKRR